MFAFLGVACGAQSQSNDRSSGATNWLRCATDMDCPDTGSCDDQDYCVDANGERLEVETSENTSSDLDPIIDNPTEPEPVASSSGEPEPSSGEVSAICDTFAAPSPMGSNVVITVSNQRDVTVGVGSVLSCQSEILQVESLDPEAPGSWTGSSCIFTCEQELSGSVGCDASCPSANPLVLAPGENATIDWVGLLGATETLPQECCMSASGCANECTVLREATPGSYRGTLAVAELNAEHAQACAGGDAISCPLQFGPPVDTERAEFDFALGSDPVVFTIE